MLDLGNFSLLLKIALKMKISNLHTLKTAKIRKLGLRYVIVFINIFQLNQKLQLTLADS
jgi:hypothetical protein